MKRRWLVVEVLERRPVFVGRAYKTEPDPIRSRFWRKRSAIRRARSLSATEQGTFSVVRLDPL